MDQLEEEKAPTRCFFAAQEKFQAHVQILKERREKLLGLKVAEEGKSLDFLVSACPWVAMAFSLSFRLPLWPWWWRWRHELHHPLHGLGNVLSFGLGGDDTPSPGLINFPHPSCSLFVSAGWEHMLDLARLFLTFFFLTSGTPSQIPPVNKRESPNCFFLAPFPLSLTSFGDATVYGLVLYLPLWSKGVEHFGYKDYSPWEMPFAGNFSLEAAKIKYCLNYSSALPQALEFMAVL